MSEFVPCPSIDLAHVHMGILGNNNVVSFEYTHVRRVFSVSEVARFTLCWAVTCLFNLNFLLKYKFANFAVKSVVNF